MNEFFSGPPLVGWTDGLMLAGLLVMMTLVGVYLRKRQTTTEQFFLGGRRVPMWAACLSFVATEVSAVTIISVPATAYRENWNYLQFFIGSAGARLLIAFLFIPAFYKFQCTTIYQYLGRRFGVLTQVTASFFFFLTRLLGSGVRLMAACLALSVLLGWKIFPVIVLFIAIGVAYMALGGFGAVVWTNVLQAVVFITGGAAALCYIAAQTPGGVGAILSIGSAAGRFRLWDWGPNLSDPHFWSAFFSNPNVVWVAVLNGFFGSLAAFGTDQDLMQRLLTVETRRESQRTMMGTIAVSLCVLLIYLSIGSFLYGYYQFHPEAALPDKLDKIFPHFIGHAMPPLLRGWLMSAIVLAGIDSPLASLATSFSVDVVQPFRRRYRPNAPPLTDAQLLRLSRRGIAVFGVILILLAYGFSHFENILWLAFKIGGVTFGSLLGVFLLGLLTDRPANRANVVAMSASAALNLTLLLLSEKGIIPLGWSWLVILGTLVTFGLGAWLGPRWDGEAAHA